MNKLTERLVLGAAALVVGLILGWGIRGVATYHAGQETIAAYQDWRVACPPATTKDQRCEMQEAVLDDKTGSPVVRIAITNDKGKPSLGVTVPLGVLLQPGTGLTLGAEPPRVFPYRTCNTQGCIAVYALDDKAQASLNSAKDGKVLVAGLDGKVVAIPISFKGYSDAAHAYRDAEARRNSWFWRLLS